MTQLGRLNMAAIADPYYLLERENEELKASLADLLRAAVEVDGIADGIRPLLGPTLEAAIFGERADALRAAVRRLS